MSKKKDTPKKVSKGPKFKKMELKVDPYQGVALLSTMIVPPEGYSFYKMNRKGTKAVITYIREDLLREE